MMYHSCYATGTVTLWGVRSYSVYNNTTMLWLLLLLLLLLHAISKWDEVSLPRPPGESLSSGGRPCCTQYGGQHPKQQRHLAALEISN